jgi:hypothetical protein
MHEYISDSHFPYSECIDCRKRSAHVCIRCHYCYSCHPKIEQLEKVKKYISGEIPNAKTTIYEVQKEPTTKMMIHNGNSKIQYKLKKKNTGFKV